MDKNILKRNFILVLGVCVMLLLLSPKLLAADSFEIVVLGDTQNYFPVMAEGEPDIFTIQTQWVKDNIKKRNIVFLSHVGDVILNRPVLWAKADVMMRKIDEAAIPYSVTFGNHDAGSPSQFFDDSRYKGKSWYLGSSVDKKAHAQIFTGGGIKFLHLNLPHNSSAVHRAWAQKIIDANPGKPTIISTHGYMADNSWGRAKTGQNIWKDLIEPNEQVFMTLNGHDWVSRHEIHQTKSGRNVLSLQVNWQEIINGGNGLLQTVIFDPKHSQIRVETYSPFLNIYHTDWTGKFSVPAKFNISKNSIVLGDEDTSKHRIWNGEKDGSWATASNWEGGMTPKKGDILRFKNVKQKVSTNSLPAGIEFNGIIFEPGNYTKGFVFTGNPITLNGYVVNMCSYSYGKAQPQDGPRLDLPIVLKGDCQFNTGNIDMTISKPVSGSGSLTKTHGLDLIRGKRDGGVEMGHLYLTDDCTYTGETRITGGALFLKKADSSNNISKSSQIKIYHNSVLEVQGLKNGAFILDPSQVMRGDQGKVRGNVVASVGSVIFPGLEKSGTLVLLGDFTMQRRSALNIRLLESKSYDQIKVTGAVSLNRSILNLATSRTFSPTVGDQFIIVMNEGTTPVKGNFVSGEGIKLAKGTVLKEGTVIKGLFSGKSNAKISYKGGDGNDVVLTVLGR